MENTRVCRLCLENDIDHDGVLVEIFSPLINKPGKIILSEKIKALFGLIVSSPSNYIFVANFCFQITPNDGLPSLVCHKCLVLTENCMEFREQCWKNDEKLRLIFKVYETVEEAPAQAVVPEIVEDGEAADEEEEDEVITLNPNKLYESSEGSENEFQRPASNDPQPAQVTSDQVIPTLGSSHNIPPVRVLKATNDSGSGKKEIYHCQFCDVVFDENAACINHQMTKHDPVSPFKCLVCSYKTDQHLVLISHIKEAHGLEKPYLCTQCSKTFIRRSDLKKHAFVHAGKT